MVTARRRASRHFTLFVAAGFLLALAVATATVQATTGAALRAFQEETQQARAESTASFLQRMISDRTRAIESEASTPQIVTAALGVGGSYRDVASNLESLNVFQDLRRISLFDVRGEEIYVTFVTNAVEDPAANRRRQVLARAIVAEDALTSRLAPYRGEGETLLLIAAPIVYYGGVEGVIAAEFAIPDQTGVGPGAAGAEIRLSTERRPVDALDPPMGENWRSVSTTIAPHGLTLTYFHDISALIAERRGTLIDIAVATTLGLAAAFGGIMLLGRTFILAPHLELERSRQILARSELAARRLALVAEHANDAIMILDSDGRIEWVNAALERLSGYALSELVGARAEERMFGPDSDPDMVAQLRDAIVAGGRFTGEMLQCSRSGASYWVEIDVIPVRHPDTGARQHLSIGRDITLRKRDEKRLRDANETVAHRALHDMLTGLPNRQYLNEHLERALVEAALTGREIAVMHIDLDRFKEVNDTFGHAVGDGVLTQAATIMKTCVRASDFIARIGGDEFVIVAPVAGEFSEINRIGDRVVEQIRKPMRVADVECSIGASVGLAVTNLAEGETIDAERLVQRADIALYQVKNAGRNALQIFSEEMGAAYQERQRINAELATALRSSEFEPYFQPQVDAHTGEVSGFEALVRWRHPREGLVTPAYFLEIAEEAGIASQIDDIVINKGLDALTALRADGFVAPRLSVNASAKSLRDPNYVEELKWRLDQRGLGPDDLAVEVLETTLIEDAEDEAARNIKRLRDAGFTVELDDFGTGYAAMSNLARLRISAIKLDRSLIAPLPEDDASDAIVRAVIALAKELDLGVIAEGIETPAQLHRLTELRCDCVQGFGIARPLSIEDLRVWLAGAGRDPLARLRAGAGAQPPSASLSA